MRKWKILVVDGRSREGAWIEIALLGLSDPAQRVAPARERGLKLRIWKGATMAVIVAPARERGLKYQDIHALLQQKKSLPRGSVD